MLQGHAVSDKVSIDELAELLDLSDWERVEAMNEQYLDEARAQGEHETDEDEDPEDAGERAWLAAETDLYNTWYDAVHDAARALFQEHGLELEPVHTGRGRRQRQLRTHMFRVVPVKSWADAADEIRRTINGVGNFYFANLREFLSSGPYTARQAVLTHLRWIKRYPDVYGGASAQRIYAAAWR